MKSKIKQEKRNRRRKRTKAKTFGTAKKPRLCVFRSAKHIYAQLVDDDKGSILAAANDQKIGKLSSKVISQPKRDKEKKEEKVSIKGKIVRAFKVGELIAEKAEKKKIKDVVFDRSGYKYHGRVKALAEGAREGGLKF